MLIQIRNINIFPLQHGNTSRSLVHNPAPDLAIFNLRQNKGFQPLSRYTTLQRRDNITRKYVVRSSVDPSGVPPSGPPSNILSWIMAAAIATVIPFVNYKWGPLLKNKLLTTLQLTEDVVEAVEKAAEEVEKVAEDIADDLPEGGKLRQAVDFVEKLAERTAKDAGVVDDFIDKVQEEEEKAESFVESLKDDTKSSPKDKKSNIDQNVQEEDKQTKPLVESVEDGPKKLPNESNK